MGPHYDRQSPALPVGFPLGCAHPERTYRSALPPSRPRPATVQRRGLSVWRRAATKGAFMPIIGEPNETAPTGQCPSPAPLNVIGKSAVRTARMIRVTVNLPADLVDRLRDAVYWSPGLTLAWFMAQAVRSSLAELETTHRGPFPKRTRPLRAGRPRLLGQSMTVRPRSMGNGTAQQTEGLAHNGLVSGPPAR